MSVQDVQKLMSSEGGPAIIDFWSPTCGLCMAMAPEFDAVSEHMKDEPIRLVKINAAEQAQLAKPFNIRSVPTLLFVNNGEILDVRVGSLPGTELHKKAKWLLSKSRGEGFLTRLFGGKKKEAPSA
ncbi:MAG: thioredoxin family protein [Deltaproteobacteria bacterium]|nr:thioredoxin family protein [Deltaproteobacteria bacterium]